MDRDPDQCGRSSPTIPLGSTESSLQQYLHRETAAGNSLEKRSGEDSMISTTKALQSQAQVQLPSLPPTSSSTTALNDPDGEIPEAPSATAAEHTEVDQQPMAPRPLAVKPAYKKRVVISSSSPDETTKRSGLIEATERCMLGRHHFEKRMRLGGSIYDRPPIVAAIPPQEQQQQKLIMKPKVPRPPKPPSKKKMTRPPQIWRPTEFKESGTRARSRSIIRPVMREGSIESLVKLTKFHKDRLAQLSTRPLPLQDLQTLIHAEQEQEHLVLTDLAVRLHKELLKLQLEEGVLLKMLQLSESGLLDASDLERVRPRKRRKSKELEAQTRARLRAINRPVSTAFSSTAMDGSGLASDGHTQMRAQDLSRSLLSPPIGCGVHRDITAISSGSPLADLTDVAVNESERGGTWGSAYQEAAEERAFHDSRDEPERGNRHQDVYIEGRYSNEDNDDSEDCDDDDDDDDDDDNDDDSDDICDVYDGDEHENEYIGPNGLDYQPSEDPYSSRRINVGAVSLPDQSSGYQGETTQGLRSSFDEVRGLLDGKGKKRTAEQAISEEDRAIEEDLYELDYDGSVGNIGDNAEENIESEAEGIVEDREEGGVEDDVVRSIEDEDEAVYSGSEEESENADSGVDEEDDGRARQALQRMLEQYGL